MTSFITPYIYGPIREDWASNETGITANDSAQTPNADGNIVLCNGLGQRRGRGRKDKPAGKDPLVFPGLLLRNNQARDYLRRPRRRV